MGTAPRNPGSRAHLVERSPQLRASRKLLNSVRSGDGCVLVVEGDPGAGKTALLAQIAREARANDVLVLETRASVLEQSIGFGVVRQLFDGAVLRAPAARRRRLLRGAAGQAATTLGISTDMHRLPVGEFDAQHGLYWLVGNLAAAQPVMIMIDDAHWCDAATLRWLIYLARRIERMPVMIVAAIRSAEPNPGDPLLAALLSEPACTHLEVAALSAGATESVLSQAYRHGVDPRFAEACHVWTAGNPLLVAELAAEIVRAGIEPDAKSIDTMRAVIPPAIDRVALLRLGRQDAEAVALARAVSLLGTHAQLRHATALAGLDDTAGAAAADRLTSARLMAAGAPLRFIHPLVASAVYEQLPPATRALDHKRAARLLAAHGAPIQAIAAHLLRSAASADPWTVETLLDAAARELDTGAVDDAAVLAARALEEPPPPGLQTAVLRLLGLARALAGDPSGLDTLHAALRSAQGAPETAEIALLLGRLLVFAGRTAEAVAVLEPAATTLVDDASDLGLRVQATLVAAARADVMLLPVAERWLEAARPHADRRSVGGCLVFGQLGYQAAIEGTSQQRALEYCRAALESGVLQSNPSSPDSFIIPISMLAICDELDEAAEHYADALARARETGSVLTYVTTAALASWAALHLGHLTDAELWARDVLRIADEAPAYASVAGFAKAHLIQVLIERAELAAADALVGSGVAELESISVPWANDLLFAAGRLRLEQQRFGEAAELLLSCGRRMRRAGIQNPAFVPWRSYAAIATRAARVLAPMDDLITDELERARAFGAARPIGIALRAAAAIAVDDEPILLLEESVAVLRTSSARTERARSLVALGAALRRANHRAAARTALHEGWALAEELRATAIASQARIELAAAGTRLPARDPTGAGRLTASERRVCGMAITGMSNPEIAQALFVTRATVESHLHSAYRKLAITSRTQLGAALG